VIKDILSSVSTPLWIGLVSGVPVIVSIIASLRKYLAGRRTRSVRLTIDGDVLNLEKLTKEEQELIIDTWIARHATPKDGDGK
jgi:hypothetical protein